MFLNLFVKNPTTLILMLVKCTKPNEELKIFLNHHYNCLYKDHSLNASILFHALAIWFFFLVLLSLPVAGLEKERDHV